MELHSTSAKLMNLNFFSLNFPNAIPGELNRENVISTIDKILESDVNLLIINGEEGIGKTTILKQYAESYPDKVISSFLNPFKELYSSTDLLLNDLYHQIHWLLYGEKSSETGQIDFDKFRDIFFVLKRERRLKTVDLMFLVDGLEYINDERNLGTILSLLPIGDLGFKVIVSAKEEIVKKFVKRIPNVQQSTYPLSSFSTEETKKYFSDLGRDFSDAEIKQLWHAGNKGVPGRLQAIKRGLSQKNLAISAFLDEFELLEDIHEFDWEHLLQLNDPLATEIVKYTAVDANLYTVSRITRILSKEEGQILQSIGRIPFVYINNNSEIVFNSTSSKRYFERKFAGDKSEISKANIGYYLKEKSEPESLIQLSKYYTQEKDYESLVQLINEEYFPKVIKFSQSLSHIQDLVSTGYNAARKIENDQRLLAFSLHGSLIENIEGLHIWESELEARIELGDYSNAISLANGALLKEDRLRLLARIAKVKRRKGELIEETLLEQIRQLYSQVNLIGLEDKTLELASDLFYSIPNLALDLIKSSSSSNDSSVNDWILARLTLSAIQAKESIDPQKVSSLISDPKVKQISNSLSFLFGKYTADDILKEAKKLEDARDRTMFLRIWLLDNEDNAQLGEVMSYILTQIVGTTSKEISRVSLLRDISKPLSRMTDFGRVEQLIQTLLTFKEEAKKLGSTIEYYQFMLNIFDAKIRYNYNEAFGLYFELDRGLNEIPDLITRAECLALLAKVINNNSASLNKAHLYLKDTLPSSVKNLIFEIYNRTAYHFDNLKQAVETIASYDPEFACDICLRANTIYRRDNLLIRSIAGHLALKDSKADIIGIKLLYNSIQSKEIKEEAIRLLLQIFAEKQQSINPHTITFLWTELEQIDSFSLKSYCLVTLIKLLSSKNEHEAFIQKAKESLDTLWKKCDTDVSKIEIGFLIAGELGKIDEAYSKKYLQAADDLKRDIWPDSLNTLTVYSLNIKLLVRIYCGLLKKKHNTEEQFFKIKELINNIPSPTLRCNLWGYFAFFANWKKDFNLRERITNQEVKPLIYSINDYSTWSDLVVYVAPLLYLNSSISTLDTIKTLSPIKKEDALSAIIDTMLSEGFPGEAMDEAEGTKRPSYEELFEVCALVEMMNDDSSIYFAIEEICKIVSDARTYSVIQRENIRQQLAKIIDQKLPNSNFIRHEGFKITAYAQLLRFEKDPKKQELALKDLIDKTNLVVQNKSDRAFILIILSELLPNIKVKQFTQSDLINSAFQLIETIESDVEFIQRVEFFSRRLHKHNPTLWKKKIQEAFDKSLKNQARNNIIALQRKLIDNAHRHDTTFAKSLISSIDTDEARLEHRKKQYLQDYFEALEIKRKIIDEKLTEKKLDARQVAKACNKSLAALNAGTIITKKTSQLRNILDYAIKLPIKESEPIYSYYLQNLIKRQEDSSDLPVFLNPTFNSIYSICKIIEILSLKHKEANLALTKVDYSNAAGMLVRVGDREKAFKFIKDWISANDTSAYIKICDPYFTNDDLEIVRTILEISKNIDVQILTSGEKKKNMNADVAASFSNSWKDICEQEPPFTRITVSTLVNSSKSPSHDRWIFAEKQGLRLGTSLNSLGSSKDSEISEMDVKEKTRIELEVFDPYFNCKIKDKEGEKIQYDSFTLR